MTDENAEPLPLPTRTRWPTFKHKTKGKKAAPLKSAKPAAQAKPPPDDKTGKKLPMRPVILLPNSDAAILNNLVCRELVNPSGPVDPPSPTVSLLAKTVQTIASGGDITPYKQHLERVTANQPEKAELVMAQLNQINDERIPRLVELQDNSERVIVQASRRSDVNVSEALVAWKLANQELALILKAKQDNRGQPVDGKAAVDKINITQQSVDRVISEKWEYTSPQGREIIRKKLWEVKREMEISQAAAQAADAEKTPPAPA